MFVVSHKNRKKKKIEIKKRPGFRSNKDIRGSGCRVKESRWDESVIETGFSSMIVFVFEYPVSINLYRPIPFKDQNEKRILSSSTKRRRVVVGLVENG